MVSITRNTFSWLIVLTLLTGCSGKKEKGTKEKDSKVADKEEGPPAGKADFSLSSIQLVQEYKKDRQAADAKYLGKRLELSGAALDVGVGLTGGWVELEGRDEKYKWKVTCYMSEKEVWKKAFPGQTVKVTCRREMDPFGDGGDEIYLSDGRLLEATGAVPPTVTAVDLAKEYQADPKATTEKYGGEAQTPSRSKYQKAFILAGEVEKITPKDFGNEYALKSGVKVPRVVCSLEAGTSKLAAETVKVGDTIKVVGRFEKQRKSEDIGIRFGHLIEGPK